MKNSFLQAIEPILLLGGLIFGAIIGLVLIITVNTLAVKFAIYIFNLPFFN